MENARIERVNSCSTVREPYEREQIYNVKLKHVAWYCDVGTSLNSTL